MIELSDEELAAVAAWVELQGCDFSGFPDQGGDPLAQAYVSACLAITGYIESQDAIDRSGLRVRRSLWEKGEGKAIELRDYIGSLILKRI